VTENRCNEHSNEGFAENGSTLVHFRNNQKSGSKVEFNKPR
jgi:hypothetical protein